MRPLIIGFAALALAACETAPGDPVTVPATEQAAEPSEPQTPDSIPRGEARTLTLAGDITRTDFQTYREIPFTVPRGVTSISVGFKYDSANRTVIDIGMRDPRGQRGWSGGNKSKFTIGEYVATPSYLPGRIQAGEWRLILGIPNIREGVTAHYEAIVTLDTAPATRPPSQPKANLDRTLNREAGWYRGDFHMHTAHSDGSCDDGSGKREPCPVPRTVVAARAAQLDFIAITDHNTLSHREELRELQPAFPSLLLIPGTELTTFNGHANAVGLSKPLEFQLGSDRLPDTGKLMDAVAADGGFLSINHPGQPSGEVCMGCGWTADIDYARIDAIEVVNGSTLRTGNAEGPTSGIPFWDAKLRQGYRITAIGGSDNHDPTDRTGARQSPVGKPATVVWSDRLAANDIIAGVKAGRVFIDLTGAPDTLLDSEARTGAGKTEEVAKMGAILHLAPGEQGRFTATAKGVKDATLGFVSWGLMTVESTIQKEGALEATVQLAPTNGFGYIRAEARDASGKLLMLGNPIYVLLRKVETSERTR